VYQLAASASCPVNDLRMVRVCHTEALFVVRAGGAILKCRIMWSAAVMPANKPKESLMQIVWTSRRGRCVQGLLRPTAISAPWHARLPGLQDIAPDMLNHAEGDEAYADVAMTILHASQIVTSSRIAALHDDRRYPPKRRWQHTSPSPSARAGKGLRLLVTKSGAKTHFMVFQTMRASILPIAGVISMPLPPDMSSTNTPLFRFDLDKTFIGARGRNHQLIDAARLTALKSAVTTVLGNNYNDAVFSETYHRFNQPRFHRFTGDNQDFLGVYLCDGGWSRASRPTGSDRCLNKALCVIFLIMYDLKLKRIQTFKSPLKEEQGFPT
jgi:hypothetical protein